MFIIEVLLPVYDNAGRPFAHDYFHRVRTELTERFGGVTAFIRSPALGLWRDERGDVQQDEIAIFEVMTEALDHAWWSAYRRELERRFAQREIVIRATPIERL
jgi:hypothetical protein